MNSVSSFRETFWLLYGGIVAPRREGDGGRYSLNWTTVGDRARIPVRSEENCPSCDALMAAMQLRCNFTLFVLGLLQPRA